MIRFAVLFLVYLMVLFGLEVIKPVEDHVIIPFTEVLARFCTWLIQVFDDSVVTYGKVIQAQSGFAVSIERGCNGVEAVIILVAAVLAFPAPWKHRFVGFAIGFVAIQALNVVRIISLFYLGQWSHTWFEWFHLYLWQALIIIDALVVWLVWLRYLPKPNRAPRVAAAA